MYFFGGGVYTTTTEKVLRGFFVGLQCVLINIHCVVIKELVICHIYVYKILNKTLKLA